MLGTAFPQNHFKSILKYQNIPKTTKILRCLGWHFARNILILECQNISKLLKYYIVCALGQPLFHLQTKTHFEDTFLSGRVHERRRKDTFRRHIKRRRVSPWRRINPRRTHFEDALTKTNFPPKTNYPAKTHFEDTFNEDKRRTLRQVRFCYDILEQSSGLNDKRFNFIRNVEWKENRILHEA